MKKNICIQYFSALLSAAVLISGMPFVFSEAADTPSLKIKDTVVTLQEVPEDASEEEKEAARTVEVDVAVDGNQSGFRLTSFGISYDKSLVYTDFESANRAGDTMNVVCNPETNLIWCMGASSSAASVAGTGQEETILRLYFTVAEEVSGGKFPFTFQWTGADGSSAYWYTDKTTNIIDSVMENSQNGTLEVHGGSVIDPEYLRMNQETQSQITVLHAAEEVFWFSSDDAIASVDDNGLVTANAPGECDIQAFIDNQLHTCHVLVNQDDVYPLIDKGELKIVNPKRTVVLEYPDVSSGVKWQSSSPKNIGIDENGVLTFAPENCTSNIFGTADGKTLRMSVSVEYTAPPESSEPAANAVLGDVDDSGALDVLDIVMMHKYLHGNSSLNNWENGDICQDGKINIFDFIALKKLLLPINEQIQQPVQDITSNEN